ncbi:MAG: type II toxin-antitoxin system VapC family toxin [Thermomicrobiales bacterium]
MFVDTSAFGAMAVLRDHDHDRAIAIQRRLTEEGRRLVTTNFVLAETHALLLGKVGRILALRILQEIERGKTAILRVSVAEERAARRILAQYADKDFSLVDATSFAVMDRLGLLLAFTFDRHFAQYGLTLVAPE